jgi:hypothetical protein
MHGCVTTPEEIVLTKSHYIRYAERYAALAGIVQASLLTKHLLFVGFSFDDDNFQRIYDPVRKAKRRQEKREKDRKDCSDAVSLTHRNLHSNEMREINKSWFSWKTGCNSDSEVANPSSKLGTETSAAQSDDEDCCGTALLLKHSVLKVNHRYVHLCAACCVMEYCKLYIHVMYSNIVCNGICW